MKKHYTFGRRWARWINGRALLAPAKLVALGRETRHG